MATSRPAIHLGVLLVVLGAAPVRATDSDKPAAVQLCLTLPDGVELFTTTPRANYRALTPDTYVLDLDLKLNGVAPEKLTRNGPKCLRAWLPPRNVRAIAVSFERTTLNLSARELAVDLKLRADLWYDGGQLTVEREPWTTVSTALPGRLVLERISGPSPVSITDLQRVPAGRYRVHYVAPPPPRRPCPVTLHAVGIGTVRSDNKPALFAELVEQYRTEILPGVLSSLGAASCTDAEALDIGVRLADGAYVDALHPTVRKIDLPGEAPRYLWRLAGGPPVPFEDGQVLTLSSGQRAVFEALAPQPQPQLREAPAPDDASPDHARPQSPSPSQPQQASRVTPGV
jgi:hypothetical protein